MSVREQDDKTEEKNGTLAALWDARRSAKYMGIAEGTLRNMRYRGEGPRYVKVGYHVRYKRADLDKWIDEQVRDPAA